MAVIIDGQVVTDFSGTLTTTGDVTAGGDLAAQGELLTLNEDAIATLAEAVTAKMRSGDGVATLLEEILRFDPATGRFYIFLQQAGLTDDITDRSSSLVLGPITGVNDTADDVDSELRLRGHAPGDATGSFKEFLVQLDASTGDVTFTEPGGATWTALDIASLLPHSLGGANHSTTTLDALNALLTDALLDDAGDPRPPLDNSVATISIQDGAVTTAKLDDDSVTSAKIAPDTITAADIAPDTITDVEVNSANKDGAAGTASMRTLGVGATQACAGDDARLSDERTPLDGSVTTAKIVASAVTATEIAPDTITDTEVNSANKDGAAAVPSMRTLGTGATQACAGNDARLSDERTPLDNSVTTAKLVDGNVTVAKAAVVDGDGLAISETIRVSFAAGVGGSPDDVVIYTANSPGIRILDSMVLVSTAVGASTLTLRDATGGGGSALSDSFDSGTTGRKRDTGTVATTTLLAAGSDLVLRRSDDGVAGEVIILVHKE